MATVAVLGFGVVGSGVVEVLTKNKESIARKAGEEIHLKYILVREANHSKSDIITTDPEIIFNDPEVNIVVEAIGGIGAAYEYTKRALLSGKHVVTSNKELVATYGWELFKIAKEKKVRYLFEASVGGGIPIVKSLFEGLAANEIMSITGILNGTTNYILTSMLKEGRDFHSALKDAQLKGYAEADPSADIEGHDSCRKIAILSSIAYGRFIDYKSIPTEGISNITYDDLKFAEAMNARIKLVAYSRRIEDKVYARVCPVLLNVSHALANVDDVYNAILVSGNAIGEVMFYGKGAGKLPTASAVVGDIIDIVKNPEGNNAYVWYEKDKDGMIDPDQIETRYFIRIKVRNKEGAKRFILSNFKIAEFIELPGYEDVLAFKTEHEIDRKIRENLKLLNGIGSVSSVLTSLRILE